MIYKTDKEMKKFKRYLELLTYEKHKVITKLKRDVPVRIVTRTIEEGKEVKRQKEYNADFVYKNNGILVIETYE